jgi:hypothetical protein
MVVPAGTTIGAGYREEIKGAIILFALEHKIWHVQYNS